MKAPTLSGTGLVATALAGMALAALCGWWAFGGAVDLPWAPTWGLRLQLELDGLGRLYGLIAAGIGLVTLAYAVAYLPLHLAASEGERRRPHELRFFAFMGLFVIAMVGMVTAQDLVLLFVFWELTTVCSYYLIGYDRDEEARSSALITLLVTGITALLLLLATVLWWLELGTVSLPELQAHADAADGMATTAAVLAAVAALAKSAQAPFHFWLARAMVAPTPVSAYLHAAGIVAAGVFLLARLHPLLAPAGALLDLLVWAGFASIAVGGALALTATRLKLILAYSTVSQYGFVVVMLGLGGELGAGAAALYVLAHAIAKSALFLTAGTVTQATGSDRLGELGGLATRLPLTAGASLVAAASVAGLPLTLGFFGDALLFEAALERGSATSAAMLGATALTVAYMSRFWVGVFLGSPVTQPTPITRLLEWPIVALAALVLAGGIAPAAATGLAADAAEATLAVPKLAVSAAYHLDLRAENLLALGTYALGTLIVVGSHGPLARPLHAVLRSGSRLGPQRLSSAALRGLERTSNALHDFEVHDLRMRVATVLLPCAMLVGAAVAATASTEDYAFGGLGLSDVGLIAALVAASVSAVALTLPRQQITIVVLLTALGFSLALAYAFIGAPDVALVALIIELLLGLLLVAVLALIPQSVLRREARLTESRRRTLRDRGIAVVAALFALAVVWGTLSRPAPQTSVAAEHVRLAEDAHADDVVTAILADFRALDTLVEISVVAVAVSGLLTLLRRGRLW